LQSQIDKAGLQSDIDALKTQLQDAASTASAAKTTAESALAKANDAAVKAVIRVLDKNKEHIITPAFIIKDRVVGRKAELNEELGLRIQLNEINPQTGKFTFAVNRTQRQWIVMKALEKPLINLLWIGTLVVMLGFTLSTVRRYRDFTKMRDRAA
jgi:cytochrome c-type biogenesis protein CcmF